MVTTTEFVIVLSSLVYLSNRNVLPIFLSNQTFIYNTIPIVTLMYKYIYREKLLQFIQS